RRKTLTPRRRAQTRYTTRNDLTPRLRAVRLCSISVMGPRTLPSLYWGRAEGRGLEPSRALNQVGRKPPDRWDNADRNPAPTPQLEPSNPCLRLVARIAPLVAFGLGLRILTTGQATYRQYFYCGACGRQSQKFVATAMNQG